MKVNASVSTSIGRPGPIGGPGPPGPAGSGLRTLVANGAISKGKVLDLSNNRATVRANGAQLSTIRGVAMADATNTSAVEILTQGPLDPSIFSLSAGIACRIGSDTSGNIVRVTDPTLASGPEYLGWCDTTGRIYLQPEVSASFNVKDFGAVADYDAVNNIGTDNYPAFAAAIAAGQAYSVVISGIGVLVGSYDVVIPPGNYLIKSTLQLPRHCSLKGAANSRTTVLSFDVPASRFASPWGDAILIDQGPSNFSTYSEFRDFHVVNVKHGSAATRAANTGSGIEVIGNAYLTFTNITVDGFRISITLDAPNGIYFKNCSFSGASLGPYSGYPTLDEGYGDDVGMWLASCGFQASITTSGAACGTLTAGDTLVMSFDHGNSFTVTFGNSETASSVAAKINIAAQTAYSNSFVYAVASGSEIQLTTKLIGWSQGQISLISGAALAKLHFPIRVKVSGVGANYAAITNGQTAVLNIDGAGSFTTTFASGETARTAVKKINQAANIAYSDTFTYARMIGLQVVLYSKKTLDGSVNIISGSALASLGLTTGSRSNIGGIVDGTGNGHGTESIAASGLVNDIVVDGCALGGQTNVWDQDGLGHTFNDCISEGGYICRVSGGISQKWSNIQQEGGNHECLFLVDGISIDFKVENSVLQCFSSGFGTTGGTSLFGFSDPNASIQNLTLDNILIGSTGDNRAIIDALEASPGSNSTFNVLYGLTLKNVSSNLNNPVISYESSDSTTFVLGQAGVDRGCIGLGVAKPRANLDIATGSLFTTPLAAFQIRQAPNTPNNPVVFLSTDFTRHEHGMGRVDFGGVNTQQGLTEFFAKGDIAGGAADVLLEYPVSNQVGFDIEVVVVMHAYGSASGQRTILRRFGVAYGGNPVLDSDTTQDNNRVINVAGLTFIQPTLTVNGQNVRISVKAATGDTMRYLVHTKLIQRTVF